MKRLLNTLFITTDGSYLARKGQTVVVRQDGKIKLQVPIHTLNNIVCLGRVHISPALIGLCSENKTPIAILNHYGRFLGRIIGPTAGNILLRKKHFRFAEDESLSAPIARACVIAKIINTRTVLLRTVRDHSAISGTQQIEYVIGILTSLLEELKFPKQIYQIRAIEAQAARAYFSVFNHLIIAQKNDFVFHERSRRPPLDRVNAILSFLYTVLANDISCALESVGLDSSMGFFHKDRPGRASLALDIMEEFRPMLADRIALSLINRQQIKTNNFTITETGAVRMDDKAKRTLLATYQKRKQEEIKHPFLGETVQIGLLPFIQALLLARHIRGDLDGYPAFIWK